MSLTNPIVSDAAANGNELIPIYESSKHEELPSLLLLSCGLLIPCLIVYFMSVTNEMRVTAVVFAFTGLLVILARPFWGLIFLVGLLYVRPEESIAALAGMRLVLFVSLAALISMLLKISLKKERILRHPINLMLFGFLIAVTLSTLQMKMLSYTLVATQDMLKLVILALLVINLTKTKKEYQILVKSMLIFSGYLTFYSIYLYLKGSVISEHGLERSIGTGIFNDPNDLAITLIAGLALALSEMTRNKGLMKLFYLLLSGVMIWAIFLTHSRGGMIGLIAVVGGTFYLNLENKKIAILMIGLSASVLYGLGSGSRMTQFDSNEESANSRFRFWENGYNLLMENPALGVGYGAFTDLNHGKTAHNSFVLCFAETGLLGYFFWMGGLFHSFKKNKDSEADSTENRELTRYLSATRLALFSYLVGAFWLSRTYSPITFLLISLPIAASAILSPGEFIGISKKERKKDAFKILALSLISILFIRILAWKFA